MTPPKTMQKHYNNKKMEISIFEDALELLEKRCDVFDIHHAINLSRINLGMPIVTQDIEKFYTVLNKHKPHNKFERVIWFEWNKEGRQKSIEIMNKCIKELNDNLQIASKGW